VWQSFLSIFPHLSGGTMATSQTCCHLPGEMLNSAAECADRARIDLKFRLWTVSYSGIKPRKNNSLRNHTFINYGVVTEGHMQSMTNARECVGQFCFANAGTQSHVKSKTESHGKMQADTDIK
jgi:hypothetical protein